MSESNKTSEADSFTARLRESWARRVDDPNGYQNLQTTISSYFEGSNNPFVSFLDLTERLIVADSKARQHETLYNFVWERFLAWQQSVLLDFNNPMAWSAKFGYFLKEQVQLRALTLALKNDFRNFSLASTLFRFSSHPTLPVCDLLSKTVRDLSEAKNYPKIATILDNQLDILAPHLLFDDGMLEKVVLYLLCMNKARTARATLAKITPFERTHSVLLFLDSLMDTQNPSAQISRIREELEMGDDFHVQTEILDASIAKLPRELDLQILNYRNMTLHDMKKKVSFLVRCTFGLEAEMDVTTFRDLILTFSHIDDRFLHFVIGSLIKFHLYAEANFFVDRFNLHHAFPLDRNAQNVLPNAVDNHSYYQFPLSDQVIFFVDTVHKFQCAMAYILSMANQPDIMQKSVGMDTEWTGVVPPGREQTISILQLALTDRVFILDLEHLACHLSCQDWEALRLFLHSPALQKVAHGFKGDMAMLTKSFPCEFEHVEPQSVVDLEVLSCRVWEALRARANDTGNTNNSKFVNKDNKPPRSLANVAEWVLGQRIPKMFRMSNWGRRPLDRGQLLYAAADAYCLLQIYRELCFLIASQQLQVITD